jgi:hypothetical protein
VSPNPFIGITQYCTSMTIPSTNTFLENWDTLPNELKLHILCHAVYSKRFIRSYDFLPYEVCQRVGNE